MPLFSSTVNPRHGSLDKILIIVSVKKDERIKQRIYIYEYLHAIDRQTVTNAQADILRYLGFSNDTMTIDISYEHESAQWEA